MTGVRTQPFVQREGYNGDLASRIKGPGAELDVEMFKSSDLLISMGLLRSCLRGHCCSDPSYQENRFL